uniref:Uncharacterized protein n=1 Tax=Panagrolaimus sp. ES5 TaxID=591445 RepID=A0AC34F8N5_9BILA
MSDCNLSNVDRAKLIVAKLDRELCEDLNHPLAYGTYAKLERKARRENKKNVLNKGTEQSSKTSKKKDEEEDNNTRGNSDKLGAESINTRQIHGEQSSKTLKQKDEEKDNNTEGNSDKPGAKSIKTQQMRSSNKNKGEESKKEAKLGELQFHICILV